ncbi:homing endonuclease [Staphylococcus phage Madawaska]|nr:homing endonuclease [Staphylococcus phage Madawaska]
MVIKTIDEINKELNDKNLFLLEEYKGKVAYEHKLKCGICNTIFDKKLNYVFRNELGCNVCAKEKRSNTRRGKNYLENMIGKDENYKWLEKLPKYIKDIKKVKLRILHEDCGNEYLVSVTQFQKGKGRCKFCYKMNNEIINAPLNENYQNIINERKEERTKQRNDIKKDNRRYSKVNTNILEESIQKRMDGNEYEWLEEYSYNNKDKHFIKHKKCNYVYEVRPNDFQQGYSCPNCSRKSSKIERNIVKYLSENSISFELERKLDVYKYDIYLPEEELYIEIDGEQHFDKDSTWNQKSKVVENDKKKNELIIKNNLKLLRIAFHSKKDKIKDTMELFDSFMNNGKLNNKRISLLKESEDDLSDYYEFNNQRSIRNLYCRH